MMEMNNIAVKGTVITPDVLLAPDVGHDEDELLIVTGTGVFGPTMAMNPPVVLLNPFLSPAKSASL